MNVKLYLNNKEVATGEVIELNEGKKMLTGFREPSRIIIKLTSEPKDRIANIIIIDDKIQYTIDLEERLSFHKGHIVNGDLANRQILK